MEILTDTSAPTAARADSGTDTASTVAMVDAFFARQDTARARQDAELTRCAAADFDRIVACLITRWHPREIWQWGSLVNGNFTTYSDIDVALVGEWTPEEFFRMLADLEACTHFPLHLVELDRVHDVHAQSIRERGRRVYARGE